MRSDLIDIPVQLHRETEKAWLVAAERDYDKKVWLPKSLCELEISRGPHVGLIRHGTLTISERLAVEKELV